MTIALALALGVVIGVLLGLLGGGGSILAVGVFTGSMLHGTIGRTGLLGAEHTQARTHAQFHSLRRLAEDLPDDTQVYPTHGFGRFCSATPASGDSRYLRRPRPGVA